MFILSHAITLPFLKRPFQDLKHPGRGYAMKNAMNVRIKDRDGEKETEIGCWFLQPFDYKNGSLPKDNDEQFDEREKSDFLIKKDEKVILYLHGNAETRSQYHRRELYKIFKTDDRETNYHSTKAIVLSSACV